MEPRSGFRRSMARCVSTPSPSCLRPFSRASGRIRKVYEYRGMQVEAPVRERTGELRDANEKPIRANMAVQDSNQRLAEKIEERLTAERALQASNTDLLALNHKLEDAQNQL